MNKREFLPPPILPHRAVRIPHNRPPFECIALLLQGGGALGAYQAGVYQALAESNLHPDWVAGISIGAINAALIAGNPPDARVDKLREFWDGISINPVWDWPADLGLPIAESGEARKFANQMNAACALLAGVPGFLSRASPHPGSNRPALSRQRATTTPASFGRHSIASSIST